MGRGRQKAKHTKVARELKYFSPDTNYNELEKELGHPTNPSSNGRLSEDLSAWPEYAEPDYEDKYAVDDDDDDADEDEVAQNRSA